MLIRQALIFMAQQARSGLIKSGSMAAGKVKEQRAAVIVTLYRSIAACACSLRESLKPHTAHLLFLFLALCRAGARIMLH
jgi:hypothetical protein